jgi:hypothetical protein
MAGERAKKSLQQPGRPSRQVLHRSRGKRHRACDWGAAGRLFCWLLSTLPPFSGAPVVHLATKRNLVMPKIINIHDARIRTVSVGIRALTISDKQVTLAVFRQLFDGSLINADGSTRGLAVGNRQLPS